MLLHLTCIYTKIHTYSFCGGLEQRKSYNIKRKEKQISGCVTAKEFRGSDDKSAVCFDFFPSAYTNPALYDFHLV